MNKTLIKNGTIVNEDQQFQADILIDGQYIQKIDRDISYANANIIDAKGLHVLPGMIDDQVHFREPGFTHKADIRTESMAAVSGGITSFMDMPNTYPNTLTQDLLEQKYQIAEYSSLANYSFFMGISQFNLEEALKTDLETVCGLTDDGLYFDNDQGIMVNHPKFLEKLFKRSPHVISLHSESDAIIAKNTELFRNKYGLDIPPSAHAEIRSEAACLETTSQVIELAKKHQNRLHIYHISTAKEALLLDAGFNVKSKRITGEACIHHLWFSADDYERLGFKIKWNPSVKSELNRQALLRAVNDNYIDIFATDHAPHTLAEKQGNYFESMSGGPLVQHALVALLEFYHQGVFSLETIVNKSAHKVADLYRLRNRGYLKEGYYADLCLVNLNKPWNVTDANSLYKCGWTPFINTTFKSQVETTIVNGTIVYNNGHFNTSTKGNRLMFEKDRF
ncbi:dihydroorotase [Psychroflexus sp. ALD_RP9]|uniref:dihydroorotase n=1 Tax=Psychroflexus sp. ALD_RP9 TaxID=2777186 RepID=UPI001A8F6775|nr:dihydroorotase [Psychroflexus sp. ALD_RP9]QSS96057.1 dihydroorotase [Psychroflexus sp. ALD_RP9]